jgi:cytochrome P450
MPLPPGPDTHPVLQMIRWVRNPLPVMEEAHRRFGDTFSMRLAGLPEPLVLVSNPEVIKEVFALGPDQAHAGKANVVLKPFLGVHSLLLLDGAEHLRQRKMMLPAFHGERMHAYGRSMIDLAHHSIDGWPIGQRFPVHAPMQQVTLQVIIRTVFGIGDGPRFAELADVLTRTLRVAAWRASCSRSCSATSVPRAPGVATCASPRARARSCAPRSGRRATRGRPGGRTCWR